MITAIHYEMFYLILDSFILKIIYYLLLRGLGLLCEWLVFVVFFILGVALLLRCIILTL